MKYDRNEFMEKVSFHDQELQKVELVNETLMIHMNHLLGPSGDLGRCTVEFRDVSGIVMSLWDAESGKWSNDMEALTSIREIGESEPEEENFVLQGFTKDSEWFSLRFKFTEIYLL